MDRHAKKNAQWLADLCCDYGAGAVGRPLTYAESFGLWLNRGRTCYRRAFVTALGVAVAFTGKQPEGWAAALSDAPEGKPAADPPEDLEWQT